MLKVSVLEFQHRLKYIVTNSHRMRFRHIASASGCITKYLFLKITVIDAYMQSKMTDSIPQMSNLQRKDANGVIITNWLLWFTFTCHRCVYICI